MLDSLVSFAVNFKHSEEVPAVIFHSCPGTGRGVPCLQHFCVRNGADFVTDAANGPSTRLAENPRTDLGRKARAGFNVGAARPRDAAVAERSCSVRHQRRTTRVSASPRCLESGTKMAVSTAV